MKTVQKWIELSFTVLWACLFLLASTTDTWAKGKPFSLPPQAVEVALGVFDLGISSDVDGVQVRGYAFVHPKKKDTHKNGREHGKPGGGDKDGGGSDCFAFIAKGTYWKTIEDYMVDPTNNDGVTAADVRAYISNAIGSWETALGAQIFGVEVTDTVDGADTVSPYDKNEVLFGTFTDSNTVAATIVWGIFGGPPFNRRLVEWDMVFNDDYAWGNAGLTNETGLGDTSVMDFLNVATHEVGHAAGLGHPSDACTEETMFRFTQNGETKRRTLHAGDIAGIQALYR